MRRLIATAAHAVVCLFVTGCSLSSAVPSPSPTPTAGPTGGSAIAVPTSSATPRPLTGSYDVGGRELYLTCAGTGTPTIVIEPGGADLVEWSWAPIYVSLSEVTRTCAYHRANLGRSDPAPGPRTVLDMAADLDAILEVAAVPAPYVLVGGSLGGAIVAAYAGDHPDDVAGIVLVDTSLPTLNPSLDSLRTNLTKRQYDEYWASIAPYEDPASPDNVEHLDAAATREAEAANVARLPHVPTTVITATTMDDCPSDWPCTKIIETEIRAQALWFAGNPYGRHVLTESDHVVQKGDPDLIVTETTRIVKALRGG